MVDIDEIVRMLLERPNSELHYSRSQGKFIGKITPEMEDDEDICFFLGGGCCFYDAKRTFRKKYPALFPKAPSSYSKKKWDEILKANNLEEEWFEEFRLSLAEDVKDFCCHYGVHEVEAEPPLYEGIKKELLTFEAKHYEKRYSDQVLFHILTDFEDVPMTILGNAGTIFGVSFYPGDPQGYNYALIESQERLGIDQETSNAISHLMSFYFEKSNRVVYGIADNPYGRDNHFTSCLLMNGSLMNSYLPKSTAILALHFLKRANELMEAFDGSAEAKKIKEDHFYDVCFAEGGIPSVFEADPDFGFDGHLPYDFRDVNFIESPLSFSKNGAWDATVRLLPGFYTESFGEERCAHFGFTALFCDHKTGYIYAHAVGEAKDLRPFDELCSALMDALQDIRLPKTIYVNNYLDAVFFDHFFAPYVDDKKVKIAVKTGDLQSDRVFESLSYFLQQKMEQNDRDKMKNNRS